MPEPIERNIREDVGRVSLYDRDGNPIAKAEFGFLKKFPRTRRYLKVMNKLDNARIQFDMQGERKIVEPQEAEKVQFPSRSPFTIAYDIVK